jgi:DNA-binding NtrC family response regulator
MLARSLLNRCVTERNEGKTVREHIMGNQTNPTRDQQHEIEDIRDPRSVPDMIHVVISTREEELLWAVFDGFSELSSVRVTGCSTLPQTRQICAADPPNYLIIDMALLENEPMDLITLANLSDCQSHIVALTDHPVFEIGARFGKARLTFLQKPVSAHDLLLLLRLRIVDDAEPQADVC